MISLRMHELPTHDQPRERLARLGAGALSDAELLAILLRVGTNGANVLQLAYQVLAECGGWAGLQLLDFNDLCQRHGIGTSKAASIKAALEIGRRLARSGIDERFPIRSPADVATLLMVEMSHLDQEHLRTILLDTKNRVQQINTVYIGSLNSATIRVGEVFKEAVRRNSAGIIVVHNHPSGEATPSMDDIEVTRQLVAAGRLLDIELIDHLIIGRGQYVSLRERGLGFE
ncbi:MAG: DNA repair protein RadC [Chloroflexus sp.]|jgi:DNA repair protein RadC|nr:DNA repair protein RadC [Chloroflexus sp.]MBO9314433.1 DNA repair protein RadC [Chloroflexus sp.]MBO9317500.1 DNA repair protein RadC [Chloroflexus sp.]MBO9349792.1 DNA repair protein RadC [Chloroflexus sp.]MBO9373993.1 DNA repair protein RadC [Chloroflexus sp.]